MPLNKLYVHIRRKIMSCLIHYTFFQLAIVLASNVGSIWKKLAYYLIIVNLPVLLTENGIRIILLTICFLTCSLFGKYAVSVEFFQDTFEMLSLSRTGLLAVGRLTWKAQIRPSLDLRHERDYYRKLCGGRNGSSNIKTLVVWQCVCVAWYHEVGCTEECWLNL